MRVGVLKDNGDLIYYFFYIDVKSLMLTGKYNLNDMQCTSMSAHSAKYTIAATL